MSEIKFTCLLESNQTGNIVEFYSEHKGKVIILGSKNYEAYIVGERADDFESAFNTQNWTPYKQLGENTMNTSTKQQALLRLEAIETEQKELRKLLEAPEEKSVGSLLSGADNFFPAATLFSSTLDKEIGTKQLAEAYSAAFETFIKLRQCVGSVGAVNGDEQYTINPKNDLTIFVDYFYYAKTNILSPCFSTKEYAEAAIDSVGEEKIIQMFKTFSHCEGV